MRIDDSICADCEYFNHDHIYNDDTQDEYCYEECEHPDKEISRNFMDTYDDEIKICKGFKKL